MNMTEIVFKGGILQTGDRVKIPKPIIDTLDLKPGNKIVLYFDAENKKIIIKQEDKEGKKAKIK